MSRPNWYSGQTISQFDLCFFSDTAVDQNVRDRFVDLYDQGIVTGLTVGTSGTYGVNGGRPFLTLGTAYDPNGQRIRVPVLQDGIQYGGAPLNSAVADYTMVLRYVEGHDGTSGLDVDGVSNFRHLLDSYSVNILKTGVDTLGNNDVRVQGIKTTLVGSTLIFDSAVRDTLAARFSNVDFDTTNNLVINGDFLVGGTTTFVSVVNALSDIHIDGNVYYDTPGLGPIVRSPDNSKIAMLGIGDDGYISLLPLNYTL